MSEPVVILCVPIREDHTPTSVAMLADCGHRVWIARTGQVALHADATAKVMCIDCIPPHSLAGRDDVLTKPGLDEIEHLYGRKARRQAERAMRELGIDN